MPFGRDLGHQGRSIPVAPGLRMARGKPVTSQEAAARVVRGALGKVDRQARSPVCHQGKVVLPVRAVKGVSEPAMEPITGRAWS